MACIFGLFAFAYLALAGAIEQHQPVLRADQQIDTPQGRAQYLGVETLLVLPYFGRITRSIVRRWRHVHVHVTLAP